MPSVKEICDAITGERLSIPNLVSRFPTIDESNIRLFTRYIEALCNIDAELQVLLRPEDERPSEVHILEIMNEAKRPPAPKLVSTPEEKNSTHSHFTGPCNVYDDSPLVLSLY